MIRNFRLEIEESKKELIKTIKELCSLYRYDKPKKIKKKSIEDLISIYDKLVSDIAINNSDDLINLGVIISNDENGYPQIQRIDNIEDYDVPCIQLPSDEVAVAIFKHQDKIKDKKVHTLTEYVALLGIKEKDLPKDYTINDIQEYCTEEMDFSIFDYDLLELDYVIKEVNENVAIVKTDIGIRVCEY